MKTCEVCKVTIEEDASFCPRCGRAVSVGAADDVSLRVHQLLTEANLHRVRREYDAAVDKCTEALQTEPDDPEVHALLGDIYDDQGNIEEAARWYQMAVDLRPGFAVDEARLSRARSQLVRSKRKEREAVTTGRWPQFLFRGSRLDTIIRYVVLISGAAVLLLLVIGLVAWIFHIRGGTTAGQQVISSESRETHSRTQVSPLTGVSPLLGPDLKSGPNSEAVSGTIAEVLVRPPVEQQILSNLATNPAISGRRLVVEDVKIDPRRDTLLVTFRISDPPKNLTRIEVLRNSAAVAAAAFAASADTATVTVRALVNLPGQYSPREPHLVLVCDVARQASGVDSTRATEDQLRRYFTNEWWGPELSR
ncbi:MAG: tetratricopeptide repeat protein [Armatimonadetes bacterium]|nr:tetratricopeptide repeat protein [Armatimonadota bacterium]